MPPSEPVPSSSTHVADTNLPETAALPVATSRRQPTTVQKFHASGITPISIRAKIYARVHSVRYGFTVLRLRDQLMAMSS